MTNQNNLLEINNIEEVKDSLIKFIKEQVGTNFKKKGVVIGLSGGVDSSVVAALCVEALGPKNIFGIIMPEKESNESSKVLAKQVSKKFSFNTETINITKILESFGVYEKKENIVYEKFPEFNSKCKYRVVVPPKLKNTIGIPFLEILDQDNQIHKLKITSLDFLTLTASTSIKHRVRMTMLYNYAEKNNFTVVGTTNKTEYLQGYFVKYGDGGSDIEPLVHLYKTQIYQIANFLKLPEKIINQDASPDVWSFKTSDEEFFYAVPYNIVDLILYGRENNISISEIAKFLKIGSEKVEKLIQFQNQKQNKSQTMREKPRSIDEK